MGNIQWRGTATALSSVAHGAETRGLVTMLRREQIIGPDGEITSIPLVSGNGLRGRLRRVGEELTRQALGYENQLTIAAAAALRSGGALVKTTGEPISGQALAQLRKLVPMIGVFGAAGAGRLIDGCLQVGKLIPIATETIDLISGANAAKARLSVEDLTEIETYARIGEAHETSDGSPMQFRIETFRAGTVFDVWLNLTHPTPAEASFFADVLASYCENASVAGRSSIGHGRLRFDLDVTPTAPCREDWRASTKAGSAEAIELLNRL